MKNWQDFINREKRQDYLQSTLQYIAQRRAEGITIYPSDDHVFNAFNQTPIEQVKLVILGQDPYHGPNQAHGLSFSVQSPTPPPPSLVNIFKELKTDIDGFTIPNYGDLTEWANQGVLLLNSVLTVEQGQAHSHRNLGWELFTDKVIQFLSDHCNGLIFLLWGAHAQKKGQSIDVNKHFILTAPHPSPLSVYRGFYACRHFSKANQLLIQQHKTPINWQLSIQ